MTIHDGDDAIQTIDLWISELTRGAGPMAREESPAMEANIVPPYVRKDGVIIEEPVIERARPRILDRLKRRILRAR